MRYTRALVRRIPFGPVYQPAASAETARDGLGCSRKASGAAMGESVQLVIGDKTLQMPVVTGTEGEKGIDISKLRSDTGMITLDPGYGNTGSCQSAITYIDGDQGILRYRGVPIEEFARPKPNFIEVAWLLIFGRLPKQR